jgi:hypothetical protein
MRYTPGIRSNDKEKGNWNWDKGGEWRRMGSEKAPVKTGME